MNENMTKTEVMLIDDVMTWWNLKLITEQRDDQSSNLQLIFSLGHQWCWSSKAICLTGHFPDFDFGLKDNENADDSGLASESLQFSY